MKFLSDIDRNLLVGKTAVVRFDFNVENINNERSWRIETSIPTIDFLLNSGARVVAMSHRGRPNGNNRKNFSLRLLKPILEKKTKAPVIFLDEFDFNKQVNMVRRSPSGIVFLMENIRFYKGEESNDNELGKEIASLGDLYVNDAFAASHRSHASVVAVTNYLPSYAGIVLEKEIETLGKILKKIEHPYVLILGGNKVVDKLEAAKDLSNEVDQILIGGGLTSIFLTAEEKNVQKPQIEISVIETARQLLKSNKIVIPIDWIEERGQIFDIGPKTRQLFVDIIRFAKTIVWNGPLGLCENSKFIAGSRVVAEAVVAADAFSIIGGGETTVLIQELDLESKIDFISTGGGAMLEFLAGKKLPGLEALIANRESLN